MTTGDPSVNRGLPSAVDLYLDLLKGCLTRLLFADGGSFDPALREVGQDWPEDAETMIGRRRLDNLEQCVRTVVEQGIPGDLIETGVWRGGAVILMRAVLAAYGDSERTVWAADSFAGLPPPDPERYPADAGDPHWRFEQLAVSEETVRHNLRRYGLLDDRVRFLAGWFRDTLPDAPIERLALLRLDGDMYESTIVSLRSLYERVSPGGFVIIDDYGAVPGCRAAVDDFRAEATVVETLMSIDWTGVYWRRSPANS
jgi:O-methyltransferase